MFNDIYQVNLAEAIDINGRAVKIFAVKQGILNTEILVLLPKGGILYALAEMPDDFRAIVLELNELNRGK